MYLPTRFVTFRIFGDDPLVSFLVFHHLEECFRKAKMGREMPPLWVPAWTSCFYHKYMFWLNNQHLDCFPFTWKTRYLTWFLFSQKRTISNVSFISSPYCHKRSDKNVFLFPEKRPPHLLHPPLFSWLHLKQGNLFSLKSNAIVLIDLYVLANFKVIQHSIVVIE